MFLDLATIQDQITDLSGDELKDVIRLVLTKFFSSNRTTRPEPILDEHGSILYVIYPAPARVTSGGIVELTDDEIAVMGYKSRAEYEQAMLEEV